MRELVSAVSTTVDSILRKIAYERELPDNFDVIVTRQIEAPVTFHIQRKGCERVRIAIAFDYALTFLNPMSQSAGKAARLDFERRARNAIAYAAKLGQANPLVTGDVAREMTRDRKELRRVPILTSLDYSLPDRYFRVESVVSVTCQLSGRVLSASVPFNGSYDATVAMLRNQLSRELLIDDETEALVDLLESARASANGPKEINNVEIRALENGDQTLVRYNQREG